MARFSILEDLAVVRIAGTDAQTFLHAQLSSDVAGLSVGAAQLSSYCSPQGRVLATLQLMRTADGFLAIVADDIADAMVRRLRLFVLRAKVEIAVVPTLQVVAAWGDRLETGLAQTGLPAIPATGGYTEAGAQKLIGAPGAMPGVLAVGPAETGNTLAAAGLEQVPAERWTLECIEAGIPVIHAPTSDRFVPQMLGLDDLGAVSFRKGCYPGQEVIARARYRGQVKRHLIRGTATTPLAPGDSLLAAGRNAAAVLLCARLDENHWRILAVGQDALVAGTNLEDAEGRTVSLD